MRDVIRQLIIDDGVADRGHRIVMFADHLRYAGVACGPHPEFGTMCVIDMADTPDAGGGAGQSFSRGQFRCLSGGDQAGGRVGGDAGRDHRDGALTWASNARMSRKTSIS